MTDLMHKALEILSKLPTDRQDQLAELLLDLAETKPYVLSREEQSAVDHGRTDFEAGRVASDEEIAAIFSQLRSA